MFPIKSCSYYSALVGACLVTLPTGKVIATNSPATGAVHGRQIEVQGAPIISGDPHALQILSVTSLPTATDADSTDSHSGWLYVWQVGGIDVGSEQDAGSLSAIPAFTVRPGDDGKGVKVCLKAVASSGFPDETKVSTAACSNEIAILNSAPVASNITITGELDVGQLLTGNYQFDDIDGDSESGSTFQWFRADDAAGLANKTVVGSARTYTLTYMDGNKYISFEVSPKSNGGMPNSNIGTPVASSAVYVQRGMIENFSGPDSVYRTHNEAIDYCANLVKHGYSNWRLPTRAELVAFYAKYPNDSTALTYGWHSKHAYRTSTLSGNGNHYLVYLNTGNALDQYDDSTPVAVTCVR